MDEPDLVPLRQAIEWMPRTRGNPPSLRALENWIVTGYRGVRLQAVRSGREWLTSRAWVEAFIQERDARPGG